MILSRGSTLIEVAAAVAITAILSTAALLGFEGMTGYTESIDRELARDLTRLEAARTGKSENMNGRMNGYRIGPVTGAEAEK